MSLNHTFISPQQSKLLSSEWLYIIRVSSLLFTVIFFNFPDLEIMNTAGEVDEVILVLVGLSPWIPEKIEVLLHPSKRRLDVRTQGADSGVVLLLLGG